MPLSVNSLWTGSLFGKKIPWIVIYPKQGPLLMKQIPYNILTRCPEPSSPVSRQNFIRQTSFPARRPEPDFLLPYSNFHALPAGYISLRLICSFVNTKNDTQDNREWLTIHHNCVDSILRSCPLAWPLLKYASFEQSLKSEVCRHSKK